MSSIDAQIKALQMKKKKIDYISYIADLVKNDTKCIDFKEVQSEVVSKIEPFLIELMTAIETDSEVKPKDSKSLDEKEIDVLKAVAQKIMTKPPTVPDVQPLAKPNGAYNQESASTKPPPEANPHDKMNFAMNNRHLANRKVQVLNDQNTTIIGNVVGLDAPHVLVKTETGPTIKVPLEKVVPI